MGHGRFARQLCMSPFFKNEVALEILSVQYITRKAVISVRGVPTESALAAIWNEFFHKFHKCTAFDHITNLEVGSKNETFGRETLKNNLDPTYQTGPPERRVVKRTVPCDRSCDFKSQLGRLCPNHAHFSL